MTNDTILPFAFPAVRGRKITADLDGGRLTSDGGVMLLAMAERRLGIAECLARIVLDRRDPTRVTHTLVDIIRAKIFAIAMKIQGQVTRMPMISTVCVATRRSSSLAVARRIAVATSDRNQPCRGSRTRPACATSSA